MMERTDSPSASAPDLPWLLAQGIPAQQAMALLHHNSQLTNLKQPHSQFPPTAPPISPAGNTQDPSAYFASLDASAAAKQMAALTAAGIARRASQSGGTSGAFLGGTPSNQPNIFRPTSSAGHDAVPSNYQAPAISSIPAIIPAPSSMQISPSDPSFLQRQAVMQPQLQLQFKQRQQNFLHGLATIMAARNTPLPPSVTGVPSQYDPSTSPWKNLEPATEVGGFKLAGKDVDLFKLWGSVFPAGGGGKLQQSQWNTVAQQFNLPERLPHPQANGMTHTSQALAQYYTAILGPFEEAYLKNHEHQRRNALARQQQQISGAGAGRPQQNGVPVPGQPTQSPMGSMTAGNVHVPQQFALQGATGMPQFSSQGGPQTPQRPGTNVTSMMQQGSRSTLSPVTPGNVEQRNMSQTPVSDAPVQPFTPSSVEFDLDGDSRKRKQTEEADVKRVRMRTAEAEAPTTPSRPPTENLSQALANSTASAGRQAPTLRGPPPRKKIEYVPLAREVETAGGRDIPTIEAELARLTHGRPLRDLNDWGTVDIEALTMSLRSRISTELSYALTTLTLLSMMRGNAPSSGFPIHSCSELLDEVLDLLEDVAFEGAEDMNEPLRDSHITTYRELVNTIHEESACTFAALNPQQGAKDSNRGPVHRPGDMIRIIINMIRNLSVVSENQAYMAHHPVLLDLVLRVSSLEPRNADPPRPASLALSLSDLLVVRKDTLNIIGNLAIATSLSSSAKPTLAERRRAQRGFELIASYVVDPTEALTPISWLLQSGVPLNPTCRPPVLPDMALDVFTRLSQPDTNRLIFSKVAPTGWIWSLFEALVHRLPVIDHDFQITMRETWLSYVEKIVMAIYSLAFLMPPEMKRRVKTDRSLGFAKIMLRMIKKFTLHPVADWRGYFQPCARRAIEAMKLVDDCEDSFDTSQPNVPLLSFGMGYGEMSEKRIEKGTGLLGGHQDDVTWGIMLQRELDEVMFSELESLARVDCD